MKIKHEEFKNIFIYVLFIVVIILTIENKKNLHVDEIFSYISANHVGGFGMEFEEGRTYMPQTMYLDYISSSGFNIANVWQNQANDVHPPFYYLLLHIICSCNVGKFSIWYAAVINICFALLTLYFFKKLLKLFVENTVVIDLSSVLFVLSVGILQNVSFFRMYVMALFWVTLTAYYFVKAFEAEFSWRLWIKIGFIAIAGALTHYYCIIYLCATCLVFGICMVIRKRWKDIMALSISMVVAAVVSIAIFPAMLTHMFSGYRGVQSIENLSQGTWAEYWERIKVFNDLLNTQMLGKIGGEGVVFALLVFLVFVIFQGKKVSDLIVPNSIQLMKWSIVCIPIMIYFAFVSKSAVYVTDRYLFPIYAVVLAMFLYMVNFLLRKMFKEKYVYLMMCMIGAVIIVNGFANASWSYLYKDSEELLNKAKESSDENCICIYDEQWKVQSAYYEMVNYKSVTCISQTNFNNIIQYSSLFGDGFILNIIGGNDEKILMFIREEFPYLDQYEKIGGYAYSTTYRVFATGDVQ